MYVLFFWWHFTALKLVIYNFTHKKKKKKSREKTKKKIKFLPPLGPTFHILSFNFESVRGRTEKDLQEPKNI